MKKILTALLLGIGSLVSGIVVDGRLDEAEWKNAEKHGNFTKLVIAADKNVNAATNFMILPREDRIYVGAKCDEPLMDKLASLDFNRIGMWEADALEFFFAPSGNANEFYQFLVCYDGKTCTNFWAESGNIRPDPYYPEWKRAVYAGKDFWSVELEIPLTAFYMTRQNLWKTEWAMNVCRKRNPLTERTSWSQMVRSYFEPAKFRKLGGFPMRKAQDDLYVSMVKANVTSIDNGRPVGELTVNVSLNRPGEYELLGKKFNLKSGMNAINAPFTFEKEGSNLVPVVLKRTSDGKEFKRWYPINAKYEPLRVKVSKPLYRNNFYPGQDYSKISGTLDSSLNRPVTISISGPGIKADTKVLKSGKGEFSFNTSGFEYGTAVIKAVCGNISTEVRIRRLKPTGYTMAWVENGNLMVMNPGDEKAKAVFPRRMYATYYMGGDAFKKRFDKDRDLHIVAVGGPSIEPVRLVKGIEGKYGIYDVKPPEEMFRKLDEIIEKNKTKNFVYYYLSDEPECRNISPVFMKYIYDYVAEKDPYHLTMMASRACEKYIDCCDWFETHPYIDPINESGQRQYSREFKSLGSYLDEISLSGRKDRVIGFMPSIFTYKFGNTLSDYPTFREIVCHTWAAMIHGGKSIWPYAYMDMGDRPALYEGTRYIFSSFGALEDFMLHAERQVLHRSDEYEVVLYTLGKKKMFAAVNFTTSPQNVDIAGSHGKFMEFRGGRSFNKIKFVLQPHEVIVGTTEKYDSGLLTYRETRELIDKLEKERLSRPNILIGKDKNIEVTTQKPIRFWYKLFDGVRDVLAYTDAWGKCRFIELSFTNFVPEFSKVGIYGRNVDKAIVKIRKGGEWITLTPDKIEKDEYFIGYEYAGSHKTVKLRIEFPMNYIEVYEIELFDAKGKKMAVSSGEEAVPAEKSIASERENAVWQLDGSNAGCQVGHSTKLWYGKDTKTEVAEDGGFKIQGQSQKYITLKPEHWIQFELVKARRLPGKSYFNWSFHFFNGPGKIAGNVSTFPEGLYTVYMPDVKKPLSGPLSLYNYGLELHFKYVKLVREPENYLRAEVVGNPANAAKGSKIKVTLKLEEPCEDVTCKLMCDFGRGLNPFPINGTDIVELKPVNGDFRLWSAEITVNSYRNGYRTNSKRSVMLRANVLGGKLDKPLITYLPAGFETIQ